MLVEAARNLEGGKETADKKAKMPGPGGLPLTPVLGFQRVKEQQS